MGWTYQIIVCHVGIHVDNSSLIICRVPHKAFYFPAGSGDHGLVDQREIGDPWQWGLTFSLMGTDL